MKKEKYVTLIKAVLLALLPVLCCLVRCAGEGKSIGDVFLPACEWNDELFYFKQVEGIVHYGYPQGYFGFNESHALKLSFAAWSPVLVWPWILWGLLFGWNLMSPVICNIVLLTITCFAFVLLVRPTWKQLGITAFLFCLYTPFVRYMLSCMPEIICFSMLILFYSLAVNYLRIPRGYKLVLLFVMSGLMTLMRPYLLLFMLLPAYLWVRKSKWKGALGSGLVFAFVLTCYWAIKHYLGAEYFAPLFFTDWAEAFVKDGIFEGFRFTFGKLYYMGRSFLSHMIQGFRTGLASGSYFAGYLIMLCVLVGQSISDFRKLKKAESGREKSETTRGQSVADLEEQSRPDKRAQPEEQSRPDKRAQPEEQSRPDKRAQSEEQSRQTEQTEQKEKLAQAELTRNRLIIQLHLAFSFVAMFFALLLMYKLTEGSKHLLTFMAAGIFVIALMETRYYKKAVLIGVTFAYFYTYMAVDPMDYQVPYENMEIVEQYENWEKIFAENLKLETEQTPSYDNVVVWVFMDDGPEGSRNVAWQLLYALPEGFGISCCMPDYVTANLETMQSRYLATLSGGKIDKMCETAGYRESGRDKDMVLWERY